MPNKFKNVSGHEVTDHEGRSIMPSGIGTLDLTEDHNQSLVDDKLVIPVSEPEKHHAPAAKEKDKGDKE